MKMRVNYFWLSLPLLFLVAGSVLAGHKQEAPMDVTECETVITQTGEYTVVNDLVCVPGEMAIQILASDVKLDLKRHTISCGSFERSGVIVGDSNNPEIFSNVHISNGTVTGCGVGVLLWFTDGTRVTKMLLRDNGESGVTLIEAENNVIRNNSFEGGFWAINSYESSGNSFHHNTIRYSTLGIDLYAEIDSRITCNAIDKGYYSLSLGPLGATASTGNVVRGNRVTDNFLGIGMFGIGTPEDGIFQPMSADNLIHRNMATGNWLDMVEAIYNPDTDGLFVPPGAECQNMWKRNRFDTELGPPDCIGTPVEIKEVCAPEFDD